ncbi:sodium/solute symporter [Oryzomicrobium terrae]|uniref:Sodium/solute symporter n=1 Tax=Oryzomicrobium terrae TaxID=1735038 RepID=A0A5C1E4S8_9RHOO|nr:sodium:solute symporter family protein [Oryzomicrobium terrae]QEL63529.1 sodium/solute symporter [Oryzomicrobium terrae]
MLVWFVGLYLLVTISIGLYAASKVKNAADFVVAGRHLPLPVIVATVFATWFGSETVLGIPAAFVKDGLRGVVADPFGSSMCLILVGLFFARPLYRLKLLTIGDFFRGRYNRSVELITAIAIVISYLGWVSAQIKAMGLVFSVVTQGAVTPEQGMFIGIAIVLVYTLMGGMWAVAMTDAFQMTVVIGGLLFIAWIVAGLAGGVGTVVAHAEAAGKLDFLPRFEARDMVAFIAALVTMGFGSIPQQDVFQRVSSAKSENVGALGSVLGGSIYFVFAFVPMFLVYSATLIDPQLVARYLETDAQFILPQLIIQHTPFVAQVLFFGALLAAIMSCSSATLLAPSVTFTENILRPFLPDITDGQLLRAMRIVVFVFGLAVLAFALSSSESIFEMVENAYKVTLVAAFVPLAAGVYWSRATTQGALFSIAAGVGLWLSGEVLAPEGYLDGFLPVQFAGLLGAIAGMVVGSLLPQWFGRFSAQAARSHVY